MLHFIVLTIYPEIFSSFLSCGLIGKARDNNKIKIETVDFRQRGVGKHLKVDGPPFGGGAGMLLRPEPIFHALRDCEKKLGDDKPYKILISPQGKLYTQSEAKKLSKKKLLSSLFAAGLKGLTKGLKILWTRRSA